MRDESANPVILIFGFSYACVCSPETLKNVRACVACIILCAVCAAHDIRAKYLQARAIGKVSSSCGTACGYDGPRRACRTPPKKTTTTTTT